MLQASARDVDSERYSTSRISSQEQSLAQRAKRAVAGLLNDRVVDASPIARGYVHDNVHVRLASGREAIVKFPYVPSLDRFNQIRSMLDRLHEAGISCPEILASDFTGDRATEPCMILSWLPGTTLSDVWETLTPDEQQQIGRDIGEWLAQLHAVRIDGVSQGRLLHRDLERRLRLAAETGLFTNRLLDRSREIIYRVAESRTDEPAVAVHGDVYLDNIIVDGEPGSRRLTGVIDFDRIRAEDPGRDFVKLRWWVFERYPELADPVLTGYLQSGGDADAASPVSYRSHALQLIETISGLLYFTARSVTPHRHDNDVIMADDMRRRFDLLIDGEFPDDV